MRCGWRFGKSFLRAGLGSGHLTERQPAGRPRNGRPGACSTGESDGQEHDAEASHRGEPESLRTGRRGLPTQGHGNAGLGSGPPVLARTRQEPMWTRTRPRSGRPSGASRPALRPERSVGRFPRARRFRPVQLPMPAPAPAQPRRPFAGERVPVRPPVREARAAVGSPPGEKRATGWVAGAATGIGGSAGRG